MKLLRNRALNFSMYNDLKQRLPKHTMVVSLKTHRFIHPIYNLEEIEGIEIRKEEPKGFSANYAYFSVWLLKRIFDFFTKKPQTVMTEDKYITRLIMLNSISAVPGFMGGMCKHLKSLRTLRKDYGWINYLISESDNERMHLFMFLHLRKPSFMTKAAIFGAQFIFSDLFFLSYLLSARYCHKFMEYFQNQAVLTYTECLEAIDNGSLSSWKTQPAPKEAVEYYELPSTASMRDMILAIRADAAISREINKYYTELPYAMEFERGPVQVRR